MTSKLRRKKIIQLEKLKIRHNQMKDLDEINIYKHEINKKKPL